MELDELQSGAPEDDTPPVNGGPDRDFASMSSGEVDAATANQPAASDLPQGAALTPADPNQRGGSQGQANAETQWQSIRDAATARGFKFRGAAQDDATAFEELLARAASNEQANVYAQLGRQLAPRAGEIQSYLAGQQRHQQPPRPSWEAPEFDPRWGSLVEEDQGTGLFFAKPGVPPEIATKVNEYVAWKREYDKNPAAMINGMVQQQARAVATEVIQQQFAHQARQQSIESIIQENAPWLYQVGPDGQRMRDYRGQHITTPTGAAYISKLQQVRAMGVTDPRQQDLLAKQLVRGDHYANQFAQQQSGAPPVQTQQAFGNPNVNPRQALPPTTRQAQQVPDPSETGLSLRERLTRAMAAEGVTDADIFNTNA